MTWDKNKPAINTTGQASHPEILANWAALEEAIGISAGNLIKTVRGTAVLLAGNSQVQVTHGHGGTPTFVIATPNQNIGNVWITNIGGTIFTINTSASTDTDITFYWLAGG